MSTFVKRLRRAVAVVVSATVASTLALVAAPAAHADDTPLPRHVDIRLVAPAMDLNSNAYDATDWVRQYIDAESKVFLTYFDAGSTTSFTYKATNAESGAVVANAPITFIVNANWSCSNASFEVNGVPAGPDYCDGHGQTEISGTTDANGEAKFSLKSTNTSAEAEARPSAFNQPSDKWTDSNQRKTNIQVTMGAARESIDIVFGHIIKPVPQALPLPGHVNIRLTSPSMDLGSNAYDATDWIRPYIDADSKVFLTYLDAGSTTSFTYKATDADTGAAVANKAISLVVNANWSCSNASFEVNGVTAGPDYCDGNGQTKVSGTTDENGQVTFAVKSTNTEAEAEERPSAFNQPSDKWGAGERKSNIQVTMGATRESIDIVFGHIIKPVLQDLPLPSHVDIRLVAPAMDLGSNAYDATDWIRPYIDAKSKVFLTYLDAGSTTSFTYKATDADTGAAVANKAISLVVNANWSCSNASFEVNGVTAGPDWCNGQGQTMVSGTTDVNGRVTFTVKATNTTAEAEERPSAFNQPSDKWGAGERKSNIQVTMGATRESIDIVFGHIIKPVPMPTTPPAEVNIRVSDADKASMSDKSYWWTNEPASRSLVKFITAGDDFTVTYKVTDTAGQAVANVNLTLKCLGGTASFSGCTDGKIVKLTNNAGEATFTVKSTTPDSAAEPRPVAPSSMNYWDDSRTVPSESNYNFEPTVGAATEHIDRIWTHTVKAAAAAIPVANIYLTDASKAGMTDKSYWWTNEAASHSLVKFVVAGGTLVLTYRATDANGAALGGKAVTLNTTPGGGCFTGNLSGTTNSDGYVTFTLTNCTAPAAAEPYPTAPSNINYWDDSRVVSPEVKYDFWPTLGASVEHIDRVWTHTVRAEELTIRLSDADTASMTDKSYWWTNEPDSRSWVKFVTAGDTLTLTYRVTDANGAVAGRAVTLNTVAGGGCFTGNLTGTTNASGYVTFTLRNCTTNTAAEPRPVAPSSMDYWDDSRTVDAEVKYDFSPTAGAGVEHIDRVWTHTVKLPTKPDSIGAIYVTPGDGSIDVSFDAPFDGGSAITGYSVTAKFYTGTSKVSRIKKFNLGADETFFTFDNVGNGLTYSFAITATNALGTSASTESPKVTPGTAAAPSIDNITAANGKLTLEFTPGDSGVAATKYYQYSLDGGASWVTNRKFTTSPFTVSKLRNGVNYLVKVRAVNRFGAGQASDVYEASPIADAPSAPRVSKVSTSSSSITVYFKAGYNGGADITDYEYSLDGGGSWTSAGTTDSPLTIEGLDPLTTYSVSLRAINSTGEGTASAARSAKTRR